MPSYSYLKLNGINEHIEIPEISFNKIEFDIANVDGNNSYNRLIHGTNFGDNRYIFRYIDSYVGDGYGRDETEYLTVDGFDVTSPNDLWGEEWLPTNKRSIVIWKLLNLNTESNTIGTSYDLAPDKYMILDIYSIKFYNDDIIVAEYDMSTGTLNDQSGNGNDATVFGGTWIKEESSNITQHAGMYIGNDEIVKEKQKIKEPMYIFNKSDELLAILNDYIEAPFEEGLNDEIEFNVIFSPDTEDTEYIIGGNQIAFKDLEGRFRLFTIREVEDEDGSVNEKRAICLPALEELTDALVEDLRPQDKTAAEVMPTLLVNTRFQAGNIAELGSQSTNFYYISARDSLYKMKNVWGGELIDRIEIDDSGIAGRFIDLVFRRGYERGKRFEIDKDIENIKRTILYYPKTALYGKGSSLETDAGGYSRKINFADVEWVEANGDPVDKPLDQEWVGNPDSLEEHGIVKTDGTKIHRFGLFEDSNEENKDILLRKTWDKLQIISSPQARYDMSVKTFYGISDYEHEQVLLGDTGAIIHSKLKPPILLESRVIKLKYDVGNPSNGEVAVGNFLELNKDSERIDKVEEEISIIESKPKSPVTDDDFPDTIPDTPENFQAEGNFKAIMLKWDFVSSSMIAAYEIYASQNADFIPDLSNLIWKGKSGGYAYQVQTNEQWYFRVLAVNTHGTKSNFSNEVTATSIKINAEDILEYVITNNLIAENANIDFAKIANVIITNAMIDFLSANTISGGILKSLNDETQFNLDEGTFSLANGKLIFDGTNLKTEGQIDFTDGGAVIAWISGQKLFIKSAHITESAVVGNHKLEKHANGTVFKWVGDQ